MKKLLIIIFGIFSFAASAQTTDWNQAVEDAWTYPRQIDVEESVLVDSLMFRGHHASAAALDRKSVV